jgi:hypothetical protein
VYATEVNITIVSEFEFSVSVGYTANPLSGDSASIHVEYIPSRILLVAKVDRHAIAYGCVQIARGVQGAKLGLAKASISVDSSRKATAIRRR